MSTWKCDGKIRDGKTVHENEGCLGQETEVEANNPCECGYTIEQIHPDEVKSGTKKSPTKKSGGVNSKLWLFLLALVGVGAIIAGYIFRCQLFPATCRGECIPTEVVFNNSLTLGKNAVTNFGNATSLPIMKTARSSMASVISELNGVASTCTFFKEALKNRLVYQAELVKMNSKIAEEEKAVTLLDEAKLVAPKLEEQIKKAKADGELKEIEVAKGLVEDGIKKLKDIPPKTFVAKDVEALLNDYDNKLGDFDRQIKKGCVESIIGACVRT